MGAIHHLPNEILLMIFNLAVASAMPKPTTGNFRRLMFLTHVTRRWMAILLNYCRIWYKISIYGQDCGMLATQIGRCQHAPLLVSIEMPSPDTADPSRHPKLQKNIQEATNLIRKRRDQVTSLHARMDCRSFQQLLGCKWPNLKEFALVDTCSLDANSHEGSCGGGLPRLRVLSLDGGSNWPMTIAARLTKFELRGPIELELATLAEFFRRNPSLESLELTGLSVEGSVCHRREEPIELPRLRRLIVHDATCGRALALLNLPSLKHLWVSSHTTQNIIWSDFRWSEFCQQLSITSLQAQYHAPRGRITVTGSSGLDAHSLRFTEFSPNNLGPSLFGSLSNTSLSSVTSLLLIKDMPQGNTSPLIAPVCDLLKHLPRAERITLCPSMLAIEVLRRLAGDSKLCPKLVEVEVTLVEKACRTAVELVGKVVKARAGDGRKMKKVRCSGEGGTLVTWNKCWSKAELEKYLTNE